MPTPRPLLVILGDQLFDPEHLSEWTHARIVMCEDLGLCTDVRHHQQKITMFLAAMRHHRDALVAAGFDVTYIPLDGAEGDLPYEEKLDRRLSEEAASEFVTFEVSDRPFESRLDAFCADRDLDWTVLETPGFVTPSDELDAQIDGDRKPFMARFYEWQRTRMNVLLEADGTPVGGRWSFDHDNRRKLPKSVEIPPLPTIEASEHVRDVAALVRDRFTDHPGDAGDVWLPVTRDGAIAWLDAFLHDRLTLFGDYEDAMATRDPFLFHSILSPLLNLGLVTPGECVERALAHAESTDVPINALEGFVRQMIGWREFIRGIYRIHGEQQRSANFWEAKRRLGAAWWNGTTGLDPLDHVIRTANRWGWTHHIERLMIAGNVMTLCGIAPEDSYRWFMELYVDSGDWVMIPNVHGMGIFSDGGVFATKPYICGSNYVRKMSDHRTGDWCEIMDGLYWSFVERNRPFFAGNPRMGMMVRQLDKLDPERRARIFAKAEAFIEETTVPG